MRNFPIFIKFLMILSLFGGLAIGSSVFSTVQMNAIDGAYSNLIVHQETIALYLARANRAFAVMRASIGELVLSTTAEGNKSAADNLKEARNSFLDSIRRAKSAAVTSGPAIEELQQRVLQVVDQACAESIRLGNSAAVDDVTAAKKAFLQDCGPRFAPVSALFVDRVDKAVDSATQISEELNQTTKLDVVITHGVILGGLALVTLLAFFTVRAWIAKPIELLTGSMERLANGDLTTELPDTTRRDEIGTMARTVLVFKESGLVKTRLEQEAKAAAAAAETQRAAAEQERAAVARAQAKVVEDLANALSRLADGDLVQRLEQPFAPEYETLRNDFNGAVARLEKALQEVSVNTGGIRSGTGEIAQAADDLSRRTEHQAASLEQTAAALDQITATVKRTAENTAQAQTVVAAAKHDAEHTSIVVRDAVAAMGKIDTSSRRIGQIIGVIDEMAFQTNLLALNAGVEAARAGDAGRGFAVVASEVRALAQRSAQASKEIKALIFTSDGEVKTGVGLVGEAGQALSRIIEQVTEINKLVSDIAGSANEQATGLVQVNTAVNQMDQVTQQNAAMVEQATAAAHSLTQETDELGRLIARFQVGETVAEQQHVKPQMQHIQERRPALRVVGSNGRGAGT